MVFKLSVYAFVCQACFVSTRIESYKVHILGGLHCILVFDKYNIHIAQQINFNTFFLQHMNR